MRVLATPRTGRIARGIFAGSFQLWRTVWQHRDITLHMIRREIAGRYIGSMLGAAWAIIQPLILLCVFTFAFNVVFRSRWISPVAAGEETSFAVAMFLGYIIFNLFSEPVNRAPSLVLGHANYVKRTIFPLEILPIIAVGSALFNAAMAFLVWVVLLILVQQGVPWTILFLPAIVLPLVLMVIGLALLLASLGVFVRDLVQVMAPATMALLFLSPVFYPVSAVPPHIQAWMYANPLTGIIEEARRVTIFGELPDLALLAANTLFGLAVAHLGYLWFMRTRRGFADVL
jgi:lipopolysaccharide transport system permease protein